MIVYSRVYPFLTLSSDFLGVEASNHLKSILTSSFGYYLRNAFFCGEEIQIFLPVLKSPGRLHQSQGACCVPRYVIASGCLRDSTIWIILHIFHLAN